MTTTDTLDKATSTIKPVLRIADRCESGSCGAQAFVLVEVPVQSSPTPLDARYCGHHYAKHSPGLAAAGARIVVDNRHTINAKPTDPSNAEGF